MSTPKISVIIPVKNRAALLDVTLANILQQTLPAYEIIVIDDNSTDDLPATIQKYSQSVIFLKAKGTGPGAARNTGMQVATGNMIQFFDSDDLMTRDKLAVQAQLLEQSGKGMVYGKYVQAIENSVGEWQQKDVVMQELPFPETLPMWEWVLRGWCSITQACLFDKYFLDKEVGLWREDMMTHEDFELMFRIGKACPYPAHTNKGGVIYRQHGSQITDNDTKIIDRGLDGLKAMTLMLEQLPQSPHWATNIVFEGRRYLALEFLRQKNVKTDVLAHYQSAAFAKWYSILYRVYLKIENKKTNSFWQTMHGVSADKHIFEKIIQTSI